MLYIPQKYFLILIVCVPIAIWSQNAAQKILRVDPSRSYGGNISDYFTDIEYIPLETTKESLFGDIGQLIVTKNSFVISDYDSRTILFFKSDGQFLKKIRWSSQVDPSIKYEPHEAQVIITYTGLADEDKKTTEIYSLEGVKLSVKNSTLVISENFILLDSGYSLKFNSCEFKRFDELRDSIYYLIDVYRNGTLYRRHLPYNQKEKMGFCYFAGGVKPGVSNYFVVKNNRIYISTPIEHHIYEITKDSAILFYNVVFPEGSSYPKDILGNQTSSKLDSLKKIQRPMGTIYNLNNIFFSESKMFFKASSPFYVSTISSKEIKPYNFIFDTSNHKLIALERLKTDEKSHFLPVFDPRDGLMIKGIIYHNDFFYSYVSSLDMFSAQQKNKSRSPQYSPILQEYFRTQNRKSNPVIVRMKLKE